jgi:hypothetical protein
MDHMIDELCATMGCVSTFPQICCLLLVEQHGRQLFPDILRDKSKPTSIQQQRPFALSARQHWQQEMVG